MTIRTKSWQVSRTLTASKAKKPDNRAYIVNEISTLVWWRGIKIPLSRVTGWEILICRCSVRDRLQ